MKVLQPTITLSRFGADAMQPRWDLFVDGDTDPADTFLIQGGSVSFAKGWVSQRGISSSIWIAKISNP